MGKTTTCLFLEHLLIKAGYKARASGNIGNSPLDLIGKIESLEVVVLEISSFQLNPFKKNGFPGKKIDVGVFLNFTEDHLDMHVSIDDYLQSKLALLKSSKRHVINRSFNEKNT
jgi:UDP-N-acetylmuramoylalanine--D-glutamate ligase